MREIGGSSVKNYHRGDSSEQDRQLTINTYPAKLWQHHEESL